MQSFKQFLKEEKERPDWFLKDKRSIKKLLGDNAEHCHIWGDLLVSPSTHASGTHVVIKDENLLDIGGKKYLGFQLDNQSTWMVLSSKGNIGSLKGLPGYIQGGLYLDAMSITFDYLPDLERSSVFLGTETNHLLTSLKGIGKYKTKIQRVRLGKKIGSSILGLMLHTYPRTDDAITRYSDQNVPGLETACGILSKHIFTDNDVMECHEELTRAGLKEYAKL